MVYGIAVHPDHRRQGIGRALFDAAAAFARSQGAKTLLSETHVGNHTSIAFHKSLGFADGRRFTDPTDGGQKLAYSMTMTQIPVILDTDIGGDIDDTWALALLLRCPELDVKLITTDTGDTRFYRAKLVARLLDIAGRADVPIGVGLPTADQRGSHSHAQGRWVEDYRMSDYPGQIHDDGVQALIDMIMAADEKITLICIGPMPNIREALKREPGIAERVRFVGMLGSIRRDHLNGPPVPETNVVVDIAAAQAVFTAAWDMTITPYPRMYPTPTFSTMLSSWASG